MITIKPLSPDRFHELPIEANPACAVVIVAEDDQTHEIKGYWVGQLQAHIEPIWLSPELRDGGFTALKMYAAMLAALNTYGIKTFYAFADREEIANYLERLGMKITPFVTYQGTTPEIKETPECLPSSQVS
jgi:hypothetical protein